MIYTHTHTHPFNGPFSGTTRVSQHQKGRTNLDFTEARDSEWQWHQLDHMHVCTSLQTDNHASTPPLSFLQAGCPSCCPTNSVKALKANDLQTTHIKRNKRNYWWTGRIPTRQGEKRSNHESQNTDAQAVVYWRVYAGIRRIPTSGFFWQRILTSVIINKQGTFRPFASPLCVYPPPFLAIHYCAQGTRAPTTTLYVLCGLQEGVRLYLPW